MPPAGVAGVLKGLQHPGGWTQPSVQPGPGAMPAVAPTPGQGPVAEEGVPVVGVWPAPVVSELPDAGPVLAGQGILEDVPAWESPGTGEVPPFGAVAGSTPSGRVPSVPGALPSTHDRGGDDVIRVPSGRPRGLGWGLGVPPTLRGAAPETPEATPGWFGRNVTGTLQGLVDGLSRGVEPVTGATMAAEPAPGAAARPEIRYASDVFLAPSAGEAGEDSSGRIELDLVARPSAVPPATASARVASAATQRVVRRPPSAPSPTEPVGPTTWASIASAVDALAESFKQKTGLDMQSLTERESPLALSLLAAPPVRRDASNVAEGVYMQPEQPEPEAPRQAQTEREEPEEVDVWGMEQVVAELRWRMRLQERWDSELE